MTENEIEDMVLEFIRKRIEEKEEEVEAIKKKSYEEIELLEKAYAKLKEFEKKHHKEIMEIYNFSYSPFSSAYNEFNHGIDYQPDWLEHQLQEHVINDGKILITYKDFEEGTGLNSKSVKKYLSILEAKEKIEIKRGIGALIYSIKKDSK